MCVCVCGVCETEFLWQYYYGESNELTHTGPVPEDLGVELQSNYTSLQRQTSSELSKPRSTTQHSINTHRLHSKESATIKTLCDVQVLYMVLSGWRGRRP